MVLTHVNNRPFSVVSVQRGYLEGNWKRVSRKINIWSWAPDGARHQDRQTDWLTVSHKVTLTLTLRVSPCGGGVEYLHRGPASRRRRRKGKSQMWDSKIWSRVPRDSEPTKTALAGASSIYKRQTRPLVREAAPQKQDRNCQTVINIWPRLTDWLTVSRNVTLTLTTQAAPTLMWPRVE
jgi:hypothetical protein